MFPRLLMRPWPDAGNALDLGRSKTYEAIRNGEIPSVVIGGCIRVPIDQLREVIAQKASIRASAETGDSPVASYERIRVRR
jgi:excisionase family DNA binding protein